MPSIDPAPEIRPSRCPMCDYDFMGLGPDVRRCAECGFAWNEGDIVLAF